MSGTYAGLEEAWGQRPYSFSSLSRQGDRPGAHRVALTGWHVCLIIPHSSSHPGVSQCPHKVLTFPPPSLSLWGQLSSLHLNGLPYKMGVLVIVQMVKRIKMSHAKY